MKGLVLYATNAICFDFCFSPAFSRCTNSLYRALQGGDKLTLAVTGPTNTHPVNTNSNLSSPKILEETSNQKRCATPVTVTFFGHSDEGKLEKVVISGPESKNNTLSLLNNNTAESLDLLSFSDVPNELDSSENVFLGKDISVSNPFAEFNSADSVTNPFHKSNSNPFLSNNPFRVDEADGTKKQGDASNESAGNSVRLTLTRSFVFYLLLSTLRFNIF